MSDGDMEAMKMSKRGQMRLERMRAKMAQEDIDGFYCRDISNVRWLTGFENVFDDESAHLAFITSDKNILHTDSRYTDAAERAARETSWRIDSKTSSHAQWTAHELERLYTGQKNEPACTTYRLGIEDSMPLSESRAVEKALNNEHYTPELVETSDFVRSLRAVKDDSEIAAIRKAQSITDAAFAHVLTFMRERLSCQGIATQNDDVKTCLTEREVQLELEETMRRMGAEGLAFSSIVASGSNGAAPHSIPGERCLQPGDMVVMDFGARYGGYCSDMTRSVCVDYASDEAQRVFAAVRAANEAVEAMLRPGVTGKEAHELAENVLAEQGFAGRMGHGLGHGVGIDIHELPNLSPRNEAPLVPGNVVTIEPGIYLPGVLGCRLEDFGVITEDGFDVFTQSTHELVII